MFIAGHFETVSAVFVHITAVVTDGRVSDNRRHRVVCHAVPPFIKVNPGGRWLPGRLSEGELQLRDGAIGPVCTDQAGNIDVHDVEW